MSLPDTVHAGGRAIANGLPTYVIAGAGSNHNRDPDVARRLIDVAVEAGADAVKFHTYSGDRIYSRRARSAWLEEISPGKTPTQLLEEISLPRAWQAELARYAAERGIDWFSSPFDHEAVDELAEIGVPLIKIASGEIVDLPLIRRAAATGIPLIISTGMATMAEIDDVVTAAAGAGAREVGLMQCASVYPAPVERTNLRSMDTLHAALRGALRLGRRGLWSAAVARDGCASATDAQARRARGSRASGRTRSRLRHCVRRGTGCRRVPGRRGPRRRRTGGP